MNDAQLIGKILARDRAALNSFYHTYRPKLMGYIRTKVNSREDGEEICQDVLFAFLEAIRDFRGNSNLNTFLFSIAHHKVIDYYRRKKLKHIVFSQVPQLEVLVSPLLGPEEELDAVVLKEKIHKVFSRLLPRYRTILMLKYLDNMSVEEIAGKMATTFKSVESQLFRARKAFVEAFISL